MARPAVQHAGFLIPNAGDVSSPKMSAPDRVDFNTLGNARYGVIAGCLVTVSGSSATNTAGTAIVDGSLVTMNGGQSADLGESGPQDRYDLLAVNKNGQLKIVPGTAAQSPLFPDPPTDVTVLAAVFCAAGATTYVDFVIDKRKMLGDALLTKKNPLDPLVTNRNGTGDLFSITGDGTTAWANDTILQRTGAKTLSLSDNLNLAGNLVAGGSLTADSLIAVNKIGGSNLRTGPNNPNGPPSTLLGNPGDLYQQTNGKLFINQGVNWQEVATVASAIPVGSVITSLIAPDAMVAGWLPIIGQVIQEATYPTPFAIPALASYIVAGGTVGSRSMRLPDARKRVLMGDFAAGATGGQSSFSIGLDNLPAHKHNVATQKSGGLDLVARTAPAGRHGHLTKQGGGVHDHPVTDPGHAHIGSSTFGGDFVGLVWGGQNKIDAYFNDRSHTFSVDNVAGTMPAFTNISIGRTGSDHVHETEAVDDHTHVVAIDHVDGHYHDVTEYSVGSGAPINYQPLFLTVNVYLRV